MACPWKATEDSNIANSEEMTHRDHFLFARTQRTIIPFPLEVGNHCS